MAKSALENWVATVDNFVSLVDTAYTPVLSTSQSQFQFSADNWDLNMSQLLEKCDNSSKNAHLTSIFKNIHLAAFVYAFMFKVNGLQLFLIYFKLTAKLLGV